MAIGRYSGAGGRRRSSSRNTGGSGGRRFRTASGAGTREAFANRKKAMYQKYRYGGGRDAAAVKGRIEERKREKQRSIYGQRYQGMADSPAALRAMDRGSRQWERQMDRQHRRAQIDAWKDRIMSFAGAISRGGEALAYGAGRVGRIAGDMISPSNQQKRINSVYGQRYQGLAEDYMARNPSINYYGNPNSRTGQVYADRYQQLADYYRARNELSFNVSPSNMTLMPPPETAYQPYQQPYQQPYYPPPYVPWFPSFGGGGGGGFGSQAQRGGVQGYRPRRTMAAPWVNQTVAWRI